MADQGLPPPMAQLNFNAGAPSLEGALPQFSFIPQNPSAASPINQVYAITRAPEAAVTPPIIPTIMKDPSKYLDPSMVVQPSRSSGEIDRPTSPTILPPSQPSIITPHPNPTPNVPLGSGRYVDVFGNRVDENTYKGALYEKQGSGQVLFRESIANLNKQEAYNKAYEQYKQDYATRIADINIQSGNTIQGAGFWGDYKGPGAQNITSEARTAALAKTDIGNAVLQMNQITSPFASAPKQSMAGLTLADVQNMPLTEISKRYGEDVAANVQEYFTAHPTQKAQDIMNQYAQSKYNIVGSSGTQYYLGETADKRFALYSEANDPTRVFQANTLTDYQKQALSGLGGSPSTTLKDVMGVRGIEALPSSMVLGFFQQPSQPSTPQQPAAQQALLQKSQDTGIIGAISGAVAGGLGAVFNPFVQAGKGTMNIGSLGPENVRNVMTGNQSTGGDFVSAMVGGLEKAGGLFAEGFGQSLERQGVTNPLASLNVFNPFVVSAAEQKGKPAEIGIGTTSLVSTSSEKSPDTMTLFVPFGERTQQKIENTKVIYDPLGGSFGAYQAPASAYEQEGGFHRIYGFQTAGGSSGSLQSGMFSTKPLTPDVREQFSTDVFAPEAKPAEALKILQNPEAYSRLGSEAYGGTVQPLDSRLLGGIGLSQYPSGTGNLALLVSPTGANLPKNEMATEKIPWGIPDFLSAPTMQAVNKESTLPSGLESLREIIPSIPSTPLEKPPMMYPAPFKSTTKESGGLTLPNNPLIPAVSAAEPTSYQSPFVGPVKPVEQVAPSNDLLGGIGNFIGSLFTLPKNQSPEYTQATFGGYSGGLIGKLAFGEKAPEVIKGAIGSGIDFMTFGLTGIDKRMQTTAPELQSFRTEKETRESELTSLQKYGESMFGKTPEGQIKIDTTNPAAVAFQSQYENKRGEYSQFMKGGLDKGLTIVAKGQLVENPEKTFQYGEFSKWGAGAGAQVRNLLGFSKEQLETYGTQIEQKKGIETIPEKLVYGAGYTLSTHPEKFISAAIGGAGLVFGGEVLGGVSGATGLTARGAAFAAAHPTAASVARGAVAIGVPAFLTGATYYSASEGLTATPERTTINLGKGIPELAGVMYGGIGALGALRAADAGYLGFGTKFKVLEIPTAQELSAREAVKMPDIAEQRMMEIYGTTQPRFVENIVKQSAKTTPIEPLSFDIGRARLQETYGTTTPRITAQVRELQIPPEKLSFDIGKARLAEARVPGDIYFEPSPILKGEPLSFDIGKSRMREVYGTTEPKTSVRASQELSVPTERLSFDIGKARLREYYSTDVQPQTAIQLERVAKPYKEPISITLPTASEVMPNVLDITNLKTPAEIVSRQKVVSRIETQREGKLTPLEMRQRAAARLKSKQEFEQAKVQEALPKVKGVSELEVGLSRRVIPEVQKSVSVLPQISTKLIPKEGAVSISSPKIKIMQTEKVSTRQMQSPFVIATQSPAKAVRQAQTPFTIATQAPTQITREMTTPRTALTSLPSTPEMPTPFTPTIEYPRTRTPPTPYTPTFPITPTPVTPVTPRPPYPIIPDIPIPPGILFPSIPGGVGGSPFQPSGRGRKFTEVLWAREGKGKVINPFAKLKRRGVK